MKVSEPADETYDPYRRIEGIDLCQLKMPPKHVLVRWLKKVETKGGILMPQNRWRKGYMKGQLLVIGPECSDALEVGQIVQFESLADKEFLGVQDPADRDSVFAMRAEDIHGLLREKDGIVYFFPLNDYIVIQPDYGNEAVNGIAVPEHLRKGKGMTWFGKIVSISPKVLESPDWNLAAPGDHVAYDVQCAQEVIVNGVKLVVLRAAYILAVLNEKEEVA